MYQGLVIDRLKSLETRKTAKYATWLAAYDAAKRLEKKYFTGMRAEVDVIKAGVNNGNGY